MDTPNILCIMSDEHDARIMGCAGDPVIETPSLDRLAESGIIFDNAYTTSPLCVPARLSFTAGKYISKCGAWSNSCWLPSDEYPSIARVMTAAGYDSLLAGKQHYDRTRRYGFTELYEAGTNTSFKTGLGGHRDPDDAEQNTGSWEGRSAKFYVGDDSGVMEHDRRVTEHCVEFLGNRGMNDRPFFLFAGYLAPHFPLIIPREYHAKYKDRVPMPVLPEGLIENLPVNYRHQRIGFGTVDTDPDVVKKGRELYWAFIDWFDGEVGKLLNALESSEAADNTVVIYTSDHGENKGDHGMWWKNCVYEHGARIPLIVSWPAKWAGGQRRSGACSLVDLVQTIAELGGADVPDDWDGDSMVRWMESPEEGWKDSAVSEYYGHNICSGITMYRSGKYKYVYHARINEAYGPEEELYDMEADPGELTNLAHDPAHREICEEYFARMIKEVGRHPDETELVCRQDYAQGYGREK
jgi:choline-sulfatase